MSKRSPARSLVPALALVTGILLAGCGGGTVPRQNGLPTASFTASPASGAAPLAVAFDGSASHDADGQIVSYAWSFGDGTTGSGSQTGHTFTESGSYTARLTVTDDRNGSASAILQIVVSDPSESGTVAGTITPGLPATAEAAGRSGSALPQRDGTEWQPLETADFVPGELLIAFEPAIAPQGLRSLAVDGLSVERVRELALPEVQLYRIDGGFGILSLDEQREATLRAARELSARPDVRYAHPNYILQALGTPNDEYYTYQWHYQAIGLPQAWDITTGSADTVVAVVDTGILFGSGDETRTHPEFAANVLPGYDFIADPQVSVDGDGRDADAFDPGDAPGAQSSYHGTHVGGTIAAATNNGSGVAGVDWNARLLPIRVLGAGGGTLVDILEGMLWAAGAPVPGIPDNPHPADVINMSLGGGGSCFPAMQDYIDEALAVGAIIVVAAGNENQNASLVSPASCAGVITVGATDLAGARAPYSNFGTRIDVMAPGGDLGADLNFDGLPDGVLSTYFYDDGTGFSYEFQNGTSMAAPHVAGVISLMKALKPSLTAQEALAALRATARPLSAADCARPTGAECGTGLVDAFAALQAIDEGTTPPPAGGGVLAFDPSLLDFGSTLEELPLTLTNTGGSTVSWAIVAYAPAQDNPGSMQDGSVYLPEGEPGSGTLAPGASVTTAIGIDRSLVDAEGLYTFHLIYDVDGQEQALPVRFSVSANASPELSGPLVVAALIEVSAGQYIISGIEQHATFSSDYAFPVTPGDNIVLAWSDENGNGDTDEGDYIGIYGDIVPVAAGESVSGIDFLIERVMEAGALPEGIGAALGELVRQLEQARR